MILQFLPILQQSLSNLNTINDFNLFLQFLKYHLINFLKPIIYLAMLFYYE